MHYSVQRKNLGSMSPVTVTFNNLCEFYRVTLTKYYKVGDLCNNSILSLESKYETLVVKACQE